MDHAWPFRYVFPSLLRLFRRVTANTCLTAADVNIYASHPDHARALIGNHENTEVGQFLSDYLDLDLEPITKELKEQGALLDKVGAYWMGAPLPNERTQAEEDHYHGDFKRSLECGHAH